MSPNALPERPNLEHLKKLAKSLLRDALAGDDASRRRFLILPALADRPVSSLSAGDLALHDAQSVIAREFGFPSWNALRDEVEARTLSFDAAVDAFVRAAAERATGRAERLLALHPRIRQAGLHPALVLGDADGVDRVLRDRPQLATEPGGPMRWAPLMYACHTGMSRVAGGSLDGLVAIARRLCTLGADPNGEYHWNWHPELPRTVLWAATCVVGHLPLTEALLDAGADPTDGVTAHIAGGGGNVAALDLLARYGLNPDGIPGGVPPLVHILLWATDASGPLWLLEHGAAPNLTWGPDGEAALHVAARRWDVPLVEALIAHGADARRPRADGRTPYALAALHGNTAVADWLAARGAAQELTPLDRFVAACAVGDRETADALLSRAPDLRDALARDHHLLLQRKAEAGEAAVLETMLACGFDPNVADNDGVTPLHRASMAGHPGAVRVLIDYGADLAALDGMFSASPLIWAVEGRGYAGPGADHVEVARVLLAAGVPTGWTVPEGAPSPERTLEGLRRLTYDAGRAGAEGDHAESDAVS